MKFLIFTLLFSTSVFASIHQAPPHFETDGKKAVWVDFTNAEYTIKYDANRGKVEVISEITFEQNEKGYPLFDSNNDISELTVDGLKVEEKLIDTPEKVSKVRLIQKELKAGTHTMVLKSGMSYGAKFDLKTKNWGNISSGFFIRDLSDKKLLERYLPTNLEYDNYKMIMDVEVTGTKRHHSFFANGKVKKINNNHYRVEFPEYYVSSSVFYHLVPITKFARWYLTYPSVDGRKIPVTIYSHYRWMNQQAKDKAWKVVAELEADYGAWPHEKLIIYATGISGGMEYAGATETSIVSLGHELQHSYFAKGIHPADGNSGWMDEAIASWRDKGHLTLEKPFYESINLGNHSVYTRKTDKNSYKYGRSFMGYLDYKIKATGATGLKDFLATYVQKRMHTSVTTQDFKSDVEEYSGLDLSADFNQYIFGKSLEKGMKPFNLKSDNPHHPVIDQKTLDSIL